MPAELKEQWPHDPDAKPGQRGHMASHPRLFGKEEGMADRLREHVRILGTDKSLPWVGLGLCDDLMKAAEMIDGKAGKLPLTTARAEVFAQLAGEARDGVKRQPPAPEPELKDWEKSVISIPAVEFDL